MSKEETEYRIETQTDGLQTVLTKVDKATFKEVASRLIDEEINYRVSKRVPGSLYLYPGFNVDDDELKQFYNLVSSEGVC